MLPGTHESTRRGSLADRPRASRPGPSPGPNTGAAGRWRPALIVALSALTIALAASTPVRADSVTVTNVRLGRPGDRWLVDLQYRKIERETRAGQYGYAVTFDVAGHGEVRLFWPRTAIDFSSKRKRARLRVMTLDRGRLWYPARITALSLPRVHRGIVQVDKAYKRDARGGKAAAQAFADIALQGGMVPRPTGRVSLGPKSRPSSKPPSGGSGATSKPPSGGSGATSKPPSGGSGATSKPPSGGSGGSGGSSRPPGGPGAAAGAVAGTTATVKPSRRALGRALEAAGQSRPEGWAAHHIVAGSAGRAQKARDILRKFGIGINDAKNGTFLPATMRTSNPTGAAVHSTLHTKRYYDKVNELLKTATTREEAVKTLQRIRDLLLKGRFPK